MKENSIEEDMEIVENYLADSAINETDSDFFKNGGWEIVDLKIPKSMQHILSDYKKLQEEFKQVDHECERLEEKEVRLIKENEKINSLIKKLEKDSKERQWIQTVDDEYVAYTEKAIYADELLSFLRGEE